MITRQRLSITFAVALFCSVLSAKAQEVAGTSILTVTTTGRVYAYGTTTCDYGSGSYYDVGASVVLFTGSTPDISQMSVVDQDNEIATRSRVEGSVTTTLAAGQYYAVETAHYIKAVAPSRGNWLDYYGFSLLPFESDESNDGGYDGVAPDVRVNVSSQEIDLAETYTYGGDPSVLFADPVLSADTINSPVSNGDGTFRVTMSSEAYTDLAQNGFIDAATIEQDLQACPPGWTAVVCEVVVGGAIAYESARLIISSDLANYIYNKFKQRVPAPIPYPGNSPNQGPPGWTPGTGKNGKPYYTNPSNPNQSAAPDLDNDAEGPHWDYNDRGQKPSNWRLWPDGKMTPK